VSAPIFISYSSKDQDIAETICQGLEVRGLSCWIACRDVHPGENFQESIVRAIRSARIMLLVFTTNANNSDEIKKELVLAGRHQVTVIPVRAEDVAPSDAFAYEFATRQWVDLFKDWEREIESLSSRIGHILDTSEPSEADAAKRAMSSLRRPVRPSLRNRPLVWGLPLIAVVIFVGGIVFYTKPFAPSPPPSSQAATQAPAAAPPPPVQTAVQTPSNSSAPSALPVEPSPATVPASATPAPAPEPAQSASPSPSAAPVTPAPTPSQSAAVTPAAPAQPPQSNADEGTWQTATSVNTVAAFASYLKEFPSGGHVQDAQLKMADLIMSGATATKNYDGRWQTTWTCTNVSRFPGYSFRFVGQVKDGSYSGLRGVKGQPGSLDLNGKIEPDGTAAFFGEIIVNSSFVALGAARGTPSDFHAIAQFQKATGTGTRVEGRPCSLSFARQ
jgi:hypothetical protein